MHVYVYVYIRIFSLQLFREWCLSRRPCHMWKRVVATQSQERFSRPHKRKKFYNEKKFLGLTSNIGVREVISPNGSNLFQINRTKGNPEIWNECCGLHVFLFDKSRSNVWDKNWFTKGCSGIWMNPLQRNKKFRSKLYLKFIKIYFIWNFFRFFGLEKQSYDRRRLNDTHTCLRTYTHTCIYIHPYIRTWT